MASLAGNLCLYVCACVYVHACAVLYQLCYFLSTCLETGESLYICIAPLIETT